jgi:hypothetical protein
MEKTETFQCEKCNHEIPKINQIFHELTCKGKPKSDLIQNHSQILSNIQNYPTVPSQYKIEKFGSEKKTDEGDRIQCPNCSLSLKIEEVESHAGKCDYKECYKCSHFYPGALLEEHIGVCGRSEQTSHLMEEEELEDSRYSQPSDFESGNSHHQLIAQNFFSPNRSMFGNFFGAPFQQQFSNNVVNRQQIIRTNNDGSTTIEVIETSPNGVVRNMTRVVNNNIGNNTNVRVSNNMITVDNDFDDIFSHGFFENFMNHRNFMRNNRTRFLDHEMLQNLLEQLQSQNQQRGMNRQDINKIETINFTKTSSDEKESEKCPICITDYEDKEKLKKLPCKHLFHPECIDTWLVQNSLCPVCKKDLNN